MEGGLEIRRWDILSLSLDVKRREEEMERIG
jgi:hypothetical protein